MYDFLLLFDVSRSGHSKEREVDVVVTLDWIIETLTNVYLIGTDGNGSDVGSTLPNSPSTTGLGSI